MFSKDVSLGEIDSKDARANESERSVLICFYPSTRALNSEKFDFVDRVSGCCM